MSARKLLLFAFASECLDRMKQGPVRKHVEGLINHCLFQMANSAPGASTENRRDCIAVKHLAEQPRESSFSAKDLADFHGFPQEALAKILQRLARTGLLLSHHGIKGGYSLARDPHQISVLEVIKAIEGAPRDGIRGKHWQPLESVAGYHQLHMVSQIVEDALGRVMISDIKEQASSPTGSCDARRC